MPKRWALILAACTIAAIAIERGLALYNAETRLVMAAEADTKRCAAEPAPLDAEVPAAVQPGGIDPLGLSRAIHEALEDCP